MKINLYSILKKKSEIERLTRVATLDDGGFTSIHIVRYDRHLFMPEIIAFKKPTYLLEWCAENNTPEAISGGFFIQSTQQVLGDLWIHGARLPSTPVNMPWRNQRGSIHIGKAGKLSLGPRSIFPESPEGSILQAGPILLRDGEMSTFGELELEGIPEEPLQFDTNITDGRYPRAALGVDSEYIWSVVCDGRSNTDVGLTLKELAYIFKLLGVQYAINMDGGGSATQISDCALRNHPREGTTELSRGRAIHTAILFKSHS